MKSRKLVNLNINPCKMCMPMGAVTAFKGIENSMVILHGSQGCSTYIRRHMAAHYNEPIDIASSSLNEEGTIYGGESNLKKGLMNVIKLYNPSVIGVATTCLAETIGEDIKRITDELIEDEDLEPERVIPVATPGYGGTQYEGFYAALTSLVRRIATNTQPNGKVNVIAPNISPGDIRNLKGILEAFQLDYILLPDVSETLDAPYSPDFQRIPAGGTTIQDISRMAGAISTIEIGQAIPRHISPGRLLQRKFQIPLYECPIPIGLENTDQILQTLADITGKEIPKALQSQRGRLLDAMIDSHKHNAEGRAVIFGEPDLVLAVSNLCKENGITPVLVCTGTESNLMKEALRLRDFPEAPVILDDTDFETIQQYARELKANILIGNSDGKVITEKEGIPLVRIGFPIHDRMGGQRQVTTGYNGASILLDRITNTLLMEKYEKYRKAMYDQHFGQREAGGMYEEPFTESAEKTKNHPCYTPGACSNARMHIPVAPACNISCNYCNRKYDCQNESRPGVTSEILSPEEAAAKFALVREKIDNLKVVGIAGPGDALANFENTKRSIELIKAIDPEITFCLSTNGLMLPYYAEEIIRLGVTHVTVTINALDPAIAAKIYREVIFMGNRLTGEAGTRVLIRNQLLGLTYLAAKGVVCKVNIVLVKGINDEHIGEVVKKVKECGAYMTNIMPLIPADGSKFQDMRLISNKELNEIRKKHEGEIRQMYHCKQCRADAIGMLNEDRSVEFRNGKCSQTSEPAPYVRPSEYTFAVASKNGMLVDEHFGHVQEFYIYKTDGQKVTFSEKRRVAKYCTGVEECNNEADKISGIIRTISDCHAVLVLRIGYQPAKELEKLGIKVIQTCDRIEDAIRKSLSDLQGQRQCLDAVGR